MRGRSSFTFKDTFWSRKRVEQDIKLREVYEYLLSQNIVVCESAVGMFFTGQMCPRSNVSAAICDLFGVDRGTGELEFQRAHKKWQALQKRALVRSAKHSKVAPCVPEEKAELETALVSNVEYILTTLYTKVSCKDFILIYDQLRGVSDSKVDISEILYNCGFDYATYHKLDNLIRGCSEK